MINLLPNAKKGLLKKKLKVIDATHIIGDIAIPTTANLLREGRRRVSKAVEKEKKKLSESLKRYLPEEKSSSKSTKEDLVKEVRVTKKFIKEVKGKYSSKLEKEVSVLEKIVNPKEKGKLVSFADPDARFGKKTEEKRFVGYKAHVIEDESQIVMGCETLPGNENEGNEHHLENLLKKEDKKGLKAEAIVCDAFYDSLSNRVNIEKREMKHYIPEKRKKKKINDFIYSEKEDKLICLKGYSSIGKSRYENGYLYCFSPNFCKSCQRKKKCPINEDRARVYLSDSHLSILRLIQSKGESSKEKNTSKIWRS